MGSKNSRHCHHDSHRHPSEVNHEHRHDDLHENMAPISPLARLIIRLEHLVRHNNDHAATYVSLAEEAERMGEKGAAMLIRSAAEHTALQNENLQKVLASFKCNEA
jgi:hypothetical protein